VKSTAEPTSSPIVELLAHIREAFGEEKVLASKVLIDRLVARDESPWKDIRGKPLDERGLAKRLRDYGIKSRTIRVDDGRTPKGYIATDFVDAWRRYLPSVSPSATRAANATNLSNKNNSVAGVAGVAARNGKAEAGPAKSCPRCGGEGCDWCAPDPGSFEPDESELDIPDFLRRPS
jgi:hypothetical protein